MNQAQDFIFLWLLRECGLDTALWYAVYVGTFDPVPAGYVPEF